MESHDSPCSPDAEYIRRLMDVTGDVYYAIALSPDLQIEFLSDSVEAVVGRSAAEFIRQPDLMFSVVDPRDRPQLAAALAAPAGSLLDLDLRWIHRDGSIRWTHHRARTRERTDGSVLLEGSGRDLTDLQMAHQAVAESERRYRLLAENASDFIMRTSTDRIIEFVSPSVVKVVGWTPEQLVGQPTVNFLHPDDQEIALLNSERVNAGEAVFIRTRFLCADGTYRWMSQNVRPLRNDQGRTIGRAGSWHDITDEVVAQDALAESERQFRWLAEHTSDVVFREGPEGIVEWWSPSVTSQLGWQRTDLAGKTLADLVHPDDLADLAGVNRGAATGTPPVAEVRVRSADGTYRWVEITKQPADPTRTSAFPHSGGIGSWRDIHQERLATTELQFMATHDALTNLVNRRELLRLMAEAMSGQARVDATVVVLFVDLDDLKGINDTLGHVAGDKVIRATAERISTTVRGDDIVARIGGDEFVVVLRHVHSIDPAHRVSSEVHRKMAQAIMVDNTPVRATVSIGIAEAGPAENLEDLLARADDALYRAKAAGRGRTEVFT